MTTDGTTRGVGDEAEVVEVKGLTKRFSPTVLAVDDVSFTVERGSVCGLLGPNGAGKTTTLRMLLGLIRPTAGSSWVLGERMTPGAPVLYRVGNMIEQAAFVPYLSGMRNLELYWEAGGGELADADFDGALAVAGLGPAVDRKVKTYSQGMRQRLGLARALLGRPELLILDEPTNGLDPQEMKRLRDMFRELAVTGTTILLSTHLLAEVEQVCTHAVVMDKGALVTSGTVAELLGGSDSAYLEVEDVPTALRVLESMQGVRTATLEPPGIAIHLEGVTRAAVVTALVAAGVGVDTVMPRHRLEDAFFELLGEGTVR
ncbi:MAG: transporter ATP-binding protein [Actinomycetia bacterium]|nr:transporter ATP-binding protein [Actinomycetes bacterium]